jgi:hypothetical protein
MISRLGFDGRFAGKWSYYLSYCEAAFALRNISVAQMIYTRPNNLMLSGGESTPLHREAAVLNPIPRIRQPEHVNHDSH